MATSAVSTSICSNKFALLLNRSILTVAARRMLSSEELWRSDAFINGAWTSATSGKTFDVSNPADDKVVTKVTDCSVTEAQNAVHSAKEAYKSWGFESTAKERYDLLMKWHSLMLQNKEELAKIMTIEQGKPLAESLGEIGYAATFLEWFAAEGRRNNGEIIPSPVNNRQLMHFREPIGVAAMITPWNFPAAMITRKAGAALAAGCTCVIKPAEDTPLSALAMARLAQEAGIPPGVFNVVPCSRAHTSEVGKVLCESPDVATISFTGSTDVGKILLRQSAGTVKRLSMELGGNAPFIVFNSADVDKAVAGAVGSRFRNAGQTCVCADRFFVQSGVYDEFVQKLAKAAQKLKLGSGLSEGVTQGPLINKRAVEKVCRLVDDAKRNGAKVICGGQPAVTFGANFYEPTVVTNVNPDMSIVKEEIFGPVVAIMKFETEKEVLETANDCRQGLSGYFYSQDVAQIFRVARRMEVGMVGVNEGVISSPEAAFGGVKESGLGREGSHYGMDEYTTIKYVCIGGLSP